MEGQRETLGLADIMAELEAEQNQEVEQEVETHEEEQETEVDAEVEESAEPSNDSDEEVEESEEEAQSNPEEDKASADGWVPKSEWIEQGKDPDDWVSAKKFNERGSMIGQIKDLQKQVKESSKSFEDRLDRVNKFHEAQMKAKMEELKSQRREAIEQADVEAVEEFDAQIAELGVTETKETETKESPKQENGFTEDDNTLLDAFNKENPWVMDMNNPKTPYAQSRFNVHLQSGKSVAECIELVKSDVNNAFPKTNPNRDNAPRVETKKSQPGKKAVRSLQWSDLTNDELKMYKAMPNAFGSKKDFLQTVQDIRKEG